MKRASTTCAAAMALLLAGCAVPISLPQKTLLAPEAADAEGKRFAPPAGKANIYIARTSIIGSRYRFGVLLDGKAAGLVALNTYLLLQVDAGQHRISVTTPENQYAVAVDARDGQNYFFEAVSRTGFAYANAELRPLADAEGRQVVQETRRADNLFSD